MGMTVEEEIRKQAKTLYDLAKDKTEDVCRGCWKSTCKDCYLMKDWVPADVVLGVFKKTEALYEDKLKAWEQVVEGWRKAEAERNQKLTEILDNAGEIHQFYIPTWLRAKLEALLSAGMNQPPKTETKQP